MIFGNIFNKMRKQQATHQEAPSHWIKCDKCQSLMYYKEVENLFQVCPKCQYHMRISAKDRVKVLVDEGTFVEYDANLAPIDPLKFTDKKEDLSQISNIKEFVTQFKIVCQNVLEYLDKDRYFAIVIGDVYKNSEVLPLGFYVMDMIKRNFKVKLKGTIIKNIEGNRGKLGSGGIWRYRALNSDYYIFKHEYIFVFKKEF